VRTTIIGIKDYVDASVREREREREREKQRESKRKERVSEIEIG
jgi:hypothetical protein